MGISDGIQLDVDGQQQAEGVSQKQLRPETGTIMRTEQTKIGEDIPCEVSAASPRPENGGSRSMGVGEGSWEG
jgi:hypothetical protein